MPILENQRHEIFCQGIASGLLSGDSYLKAYPEAKITSARTIGARLIKVAEIQTRINELKLQNVAKSSLTRQRMIERLTDAFEGRLKDSQGNTLETKVSDIIKASERLCKIMGWDEPEEHVVSGDFAINDSISILLQQVAAVRQANKSLFKPGETNADPP